MLTLDDKRNENGTGPQPHAESLAEFLGRELNVVVMPSQGFELGGPPAEKVVEDFVFPPVESDVHEAVKKYYKMKGYSVEQAAKGTVIVRDGERKVMAISITNDAVQSWITVLEITT